MDFLISKFVYGVSLKINVKYNWSEMRSLWLTNESDGYMIKLHFNIPLKGK